MATLKMEVHGLAELLAGLEKLGQDMTGALDDVVNATGLELRGDIIKRYQRGPASGKVYRKYKPNRTHQSSAPGQSPMTDTGRLQGGTMFDKTGPASVRVFNAIEYAAALEYGHTYDRGRRIEERPAWRPAIKKMRPKYEKRINDAIAEAVRRAT